MTDDADSPKPTPRRPRLPPAPDGDAPRKPSSPAGGSRKASGGGAERTGGGAGRTGAARTPAAGGDPPAYTRYRTGRRKPGERESLDATRRQSATQLQPQPAAARGAARVPPGSRPPADIPAGPPPPGRRRRFTRKRMALSVVGLLIGWVLLSLVLFLVSATFNRSSPPSDVKAVLDPAGYPLTSANNILVLGSDRREKNSREPGADSSGPSRSDSIMLIRTGGGHAARLSIPRDTVVNIPGHGLQKINAAYAFGGPALSIKVVENYLGIPINHLVEVNFEDFPQLVDAMGGVDYTGGCVVSRISGGARNGGFTLRLPKGTHHLDGKQALALARTRENLCAPNETDINRAEHQQALFQDMKDRLLSPSSFIRLPWISWNAPPAIISDMSGPTLLGLFGALGTSGTPPTRLLRPSGYLTLPDGGDALSVSEAERRKAAAQFMAG